MSARRIDWGDLRETLLRWQTSHLEADATAIVLLVEPAMRGWIHAIGVDRAGIEDHVADALIKLLKSKVPTAMPKPASWARSILMSVLRDRWRKKYRRRELAERATAQGKLVAGQAVFSSASTHPPSDHVGAEELQRALEHLSTAERVAVILDSVPAWLPMSDTRWLAERARLSEQEISARLAGGLSRAAAASLYFGENESHRLTDRFRKVVSRARKRAEQADDESYRVGSGEWEQ